MFLAALTSYMMNGADGLGTIAVSVFFLLTVVSALFVLAGIIGQILLKIRGLGKTLRKTQLITSLGFSVCGALCGTMFSLASVITDLVFHIETGVCLASQCLMRLGCIICFLFGLPVIKSFHKTN